MIINKEKIEVDKYLDGLIEYCKTTECCNCNKRVKALCDSLEDILHIELESTKLLVETENK